MLHFNNGDLSLNIWQPNIEGTHVKLEREHNGERIVLSFDLNENLNQDEGDADEEMYDEEVVMAEGKVELVSQVFMMQSELVL